MENKHTSSNKRNTFILVIKLLKFVKPLSGVLTLATIMGILGFLSSIGIFVIAAYGFVELYQGTSKIPLTDIIIGCISLGVLRGFLRYGEQTSNHYLAFKILQDLRDSLFKTMRRLSPAKMETKEKGSLISLITSDIELLEIFFAHTISPILIAVVVSLLIAFFISLFNFTLGIIALLGFLFIGGVVPYLTSKTGKKGGTGQRAKTADINSYILDTLRGLKEIIQYRKIKSRLDHLDHKTDSLTEENQKMSKKFVLSNMLTAISIIGFEIVFAILSAHFYLENKINLTAFIICFIAFISSFGPVIALSGLSNILGPTLASGNRVLDLLEEKPITQDIEGEKDVIFSNMKCNDVYFSYDKKDWIVKDANLSLEKGDILGIEGKSGSGKSTLLKLMMRFWTADKGNITMSETDVNSINTNSLRENQSMMSQEVHLFHGSILDNIRIGKLDASREEIIEAAKKASIHDFIMTLPKGYDSQVGELGDGISSGEKQRINLARVFLHDAPMIILDEPTSNIDCLNEGIILKALKESSKNSSIVIVSHRESTLNITNKRYSIENTRSS